jgi:hypothetical protein
MCKLKKVIYVCCDGKTEPRRRYGFGAATKRDLSRDKEWMVAVLEKDKYIIEKEIIVERRKSSSII